MSTHDEYGDYCDAYDINPSWCGLYDTVDFNSLIQCCACQTSTTLCYNDYTTADEYGDYCDDYDLNPGWCGLYDTQDFNSTS